MKASPEAMTAAKRYLEDDLGERKGFGHLLEGVRHETPDIYQELLDEAAEAFQAFKDGA